MSWYRTYEIDILRVGQLFIQQNIDSVYPSAGNILYTDGSGGTYWSSLQSGGGSGQITRPTVLYLNQGTTVSPYKGLQLTPIVGAGLTLSTVLDISSSDTPVAEFQSDFQTPLTIPTGIWNLKLYASSTDLTATVYYSLYVRLTGTDTFVCSSGPVPIGQTLAQYEIDLLVPATPLPLGSTVVLKLFANNSNPGAQVTLSTYYQGQTYSIVYTTFGTVFPADVLMSTVDGLGTAGYISTAQFTDLSNYFQNTEQNWSTPLSTVANYTSNTSNWSKNLLQDWSTSVSTATLFTSNTSNWSKNLLQDWSTPVSSVAIFTSNSSNWSKNLLQNWSTPISSVATYTSNSSNWSKNLLQNWSTPVSTVALFTSNTSNWAANAFQNWSTPVSSVATFASNTSNYFLSTLGQGGFTLPPYLSSFTLSTGAINASTIKTVYLYSSTAQIESMSVGTLFVYGASTLTVAGQVIFYSGMTVNAAQVSSVLVQSTITFVDLGTGLPSGLPFYTSNSSLYFNDSPVSWNVPSTVDGLGTIGYISSSQLFSSIAGISFANDLVSTPYLDFVLASTTAGLGQVYISTATGGGGSYAGDWSTPISTVAVFTSNTSNYYYTSLQDWSSAVSVATLFTSNLSNYIITNHASIGFINDISGGSLDVAGEARAITFSSIFLFTSSIIANNANLLTASISNVTTIQSQTSNLQIPQPTDHEWISFATTPTAESLLLRSSDTLTWRTSISPFIGGQMNSLVWTGNYWLAVGTDQFNNYTSSKSLDGLNWVDFAGPFVAGLATCLGWNGSIWVAMGLDSNSAHTLSTSADGENWTEVGGPFLGGRGLAVAWNGTYWLAAGNSYGTGDTLAISSDGLIWTGSIGPNFTNPSGYAGLAWNSNLWVLTGSDQTQTNTIAYSSDAVSWTSIPGPFTGGFGTSVLWNGTFFLATGHGPFTIGKSADGISWTPYPGPFTGGGYGLTLGWNGLYFLASGFGGTTTNVLFYSLDGETWTGLGSMFDGKTVLFATAISYAHYPVQTSLYVNSVGYISSMTGNWVDCQTLVVVDI
jgi:hypothetical protein